MDFQFLRSDFIPNIKSSKVYFARNMSFGYSNAAKYMVPLMMHLQTVTKSSKASTVRGMSENYPKQNK